MRGINPHYKHKKHVKTVLSCVYMRVGDRGVEPLTSTMYIGTHQPKTL